MTKIIIKNYLVVAYDDQKNKKQNQNFPKDFDDRLRNYLEEENLSAVDDYVETQSNYRETIKEQVYMYIKNESV